MDTKIMLFDIARGNKKTFATLYTQQQPAMIRYATGLLAGDVAAAEDAVDEAFIAIWQQAGRFEGSGSANGWVRRIVRNKAIDWLRKQRDCDQPNVELDDQMPDSDRSPYEYAEQRCQSHHLRKALEKLSFEHREAVWLCYFEDKSMNEIAEIACCPENTVKTRLFHARQYLRTALIPVMAIQ